MPHTLRQATPLDFSAINRLCVEAYQEFESLIGSADWQQFQEVLSRASDLSGTGELIVAEDTNQLLGVVLYVPPGKSDGASIPSQWASIRMLAVSTLCRGRGIGRELTQECIDRARRDKAEAIGLTTGAMMKIAQPMYERRGFKKEAELGTKFGIEHARYVLILKQAV